MLTDVLEDLKTMFDWKPIETYSSIDFTMDSMDVEKAAA